MRKEACYCQSLTTFSLHLPASINSRASPLSPVTSSHPGIGGSSRTGPAAHQDGESYPTADVGGGDRIWHGSLFPPTKAEYFQDREQHRPHSRQAGQKDPGPGVHRDAGAPP